MLTKLTLRNFKRFEELVIELGDTVVFVGPNNSGKTSVLQALALWEVGLRRWAERLEKTSGRPLPKKRQGLAINRRDLVALPVADTNLLWRNLHVRDVRRPTGKLETQNVRVDILVEGVSEDRLWECGLEFDYANKESIYCRPLRANGEDSADRMPIPEQALAARMAFLPPMSGLATNEIRLDPGAINVRVGEGRTAEVLRNLCMHVHDETRFWPDLVQHIVTLFGAELGSPRYVKERGEIEMTYVENVIELDLASSGRGLQQTLLLLAYMYAHPQSVLLLDEPDAHLEILRQRQIYQLLTEVARANGNQIIAASHSEVILNEAADRDIVVAFVGNKPHRIDDRGSQVLKSLKEIGFDQYYQAEQTGWVLYLEGSTDLAILRAFAERLGHKAQAFLERPFVHYVGNQPGEVRRHFFGLREAHRGLVGVAIFDRLEQALPEDLGASGLTWERREIESYLCMPEALDAYAAAAVPEDTAGPLFSFAGAEHRRALMRVSYNRYIPPAALTDRSDRWWGDVKASTDFLDRVFEDYFRELKLPNLLRKADYHNLARLVPIELISPEISRTLDHIVAVANRAKPVGSGVR